tara:strand:- start:494 stop:643 length:150 start_codon:yes stop_codon:yes gene_type:complete
MLPPQPAQILVSQRGPDKAARVTQDVSFVNENQRDPLACQLRSRHSIIP